ncbi:hypothetical protein CAPTEDRAFT_207112 [Capitella teleta]|nr:hypothetical protein CAPTEDRAFT_207112 [Capitella teleta]|eukprot:ELT95472.1 hypothetical protein CAPTEDRAFT_207112 [Capitella teleta]
MTDVQQKAVLSVLNNSSREALRKFKCFRSALGLIQLNAITTERENKGPYTCVTHLNHLKFMNTKSTRDICHTILKGRKVQKDVTSSMEYSLDRSLIQPVFHSNEVPETVLGLHLSHTRLAWLLMNKDYEVVEWDSQEILEGIRVKYDHTVLYEKILDLMETLPQSNVYLLEHEQAYMRPQKSFGMAFMNSARVESSLVTMLNMRNHLNNDQQKVFKLKSNVMENYFDISVAGRRIRTKALVSDLMRNKSPLSGSLQVPLVLQNVYYDAEDKLDQEHMSYCLLQTIFFYNMLHLVSQQYERE